MSLGFDNCHIDITGRGADDFKKALSFFFPGKHDRAKAFAVDPKKGLILYWCVPDDVAAKAQANQFSDYVNSLPQPKTSGGGAIHLLPYEMNFEAATQFAWNWLETPEAGQLRGPQPDHDGDNGAAWRVYNEAWTHVDNRWEGLVGIQPIWAMYGK